MMKNSLRDSYAIGAIYTLLNERSDYFTPSLTPDMALNATDAESVKKNTRLTYSTEEVVERV